MALNKQKGNMYPWVAKTRNFIGGKCPHECVYCYVEHLKKQHPAVMKRYSGPVRLLEDELKKSESSRKVIFVGSCIDMFAKEVPDHWIEKITRHCLDYRNRYLFQSKNPARFYSFAFFKNAILGTTIETNREMRISKAPSIDSRLCSMATLKRLGRKIMISIEPIMDFDNELIDKVFGIRPDFVSIGADSKGHNLPEPPAEKILELIRELRAVTEVKLKQNLKRLLGGQWPE